MRNAQIREVHAHTIAVAPQDIGTSDITGTYREFPNCRRLALAVAVAAQLLGSTVTVKFLQATSSAGAGAKALGTDVSFTVPDDGESPTTTLAAAAINEIMIEELDLANDFTFIAAKIGASTTGVVGSALWVEGDLRFSPRA